MLKSLIKTLTNKTNIKLLIVIFVIGFIFINPTFAAENDSNFFTGLSEVINEIMKFASRSWIILAIIAGKFMTNSMVYGTRLHLDQYLRQIRNITKNFANFGLLGFMLREIIGFISGKENNIQKTITKTLIAGILIQASRFIVGAVVDISTIATSAIGGFASSTMDTNINSTTLKDTIKKDILYYKTDITTGEPKIDKREAPTDAEIESILDKIMPSTDSVGGPLVVIGASALRTQDMINIDTNLADSPKGIIINLGLKAIILLLYCVVMLLLIVANVIRVGFLRMVIAISPIIVLFMVFKGAKEGISKNLNLASIINTIFKPVIFVAMLSFILIFITSIQRVMTNQSSVDLNGITFSTPKDGPATASIDGVGNFSINDRIFTQVGETSRSIFANLIIYFATLFLLRFLVKIAITSGPGPLKKPMEAMTGWIEKAAGTVPILPGAGFTAIKSGLGDNRDKVLSKMGMNKYGKVNMGQNAKVNQKIEEAFGLKYSWTESNWDDLTKLSEKPNNDNFITTTKDLFSNKDNGSFNVGENLRWQGLFTKWLSKQDDNYLKEKGFGKYDRSGKETLDTFLQKPADKSAQFKFNFQVLDNLLGGDGKEDHYEDFQKKEYGTKKEIE